MEHKPIRKAVFPVAGLGTRFLPATKANPKEMLPIVDKPLIQYAVEDAIAAGVTELIFITSFSKRAIEDHFDSNFELESKLQEQGKHELLAMVRNILPSGVSCVYVRQHCALGLGHAVLCAQPVVGDEPFAVLLADDLIDCGRRSCLQMMIDDYHRTGHGVLAVEAVNPAETKKYGIVEVDQQQRITGIIEKPEPTMAPSNLAAIGRYILPAQIFSHLEQVKPGVGGEIQLTDAISALLAKQPMLAHQLQGVRYDCGSKFGYLKATVNFGLKHPHVKDRFADYLQSLLESKSVVES